MKTAIKLVMISALGVLTSAATLAQTSPGDDASPQNPPLGRPGSERPGREAHRKALLERYDADKDGKLDDAELAALGKDVFEGKLPPPGRGPAGQGERGRPQFGAQGRGGPDGRDFCPCGSLDGDKPAPRYGRMMDRGNFGREGGPEGARFGPPPRGFGRPDSEEGRKMLEEHRREFLKQYDANGDGKLDSAEREAIGKDIEDGKLPPPPPGREMPPKEQ